MSIIYQASRYFKNLAIVRDDQVLNPETIKSHRDELVEMELQEKYFLIINFYVDVITHTASNELPNT